MHMSIYFIEKPQLYNKTIIIENNNNKIQIPNLENNNKI